MNRPIILFRFHGEFELCRERIELLAALNRGVPICGVYGGPAEHFPAARAAVGDVILDLQPAEPHEPMWHWLHMDLDVKHWYRAFGHSIDFDVLFDYEWDILTTDALKSIYPLIDQNTIALCSLTRLTPDVERSWHWTSYGEHVPKYERFLEYMHREFEMQSLEYVSHGPGTVLPRRFLEQFAELEDVEMTISEIKYPAYAQVLGYTLVDNNLRVGAVTDDREDDCFNSQPDRPIAYQRIVSEIMKPNGRRAFHPVKYSFPKRRYRRLQCQRAARRAGLLAQDWLARSARVTG
jgi:hypothetical protein